MTAIVAIKKDGKVYMGGDSARSTQWHVMLSNERKITTFSNGLLIGCAGSLRLIQVLKYHLTPPTHKKSTSNNEYIVCSLVEEIKQLAGQFGVTQVYEGGEVLSSNSQILIGYRGGLYVMESDFHVDIPKDPYAAIGSGSEYALGSLATTDSLTTTDPQLRIYQALRVSGYFSPSVSSPYYCYVAEGDSLACTIGDD